jgi:cell wall-associated NlpC family hydrolase
MSERDAFVACAKAQVGKQYQWATAGPETFDCSGLVAFCYREATGKNLTRSSHEQALLGEPVTGPLQPGDLLIYGHGDHVGVVSGPDRAVHALNDQLDVREVHISTANIGLRYDGARRLSWRDDPDPKVLRPKHRRRRRRR